MRIARGSEGQPGGLKASLGRLNVSQGGSDGSLRGFEGQTGGLRASQGGLRASHESLAASQGGHAYGGKISPFSRTLFPIGLAAQKGRARELLTIQCNWLFIKVLLIH